MNGFYSSRNWMELKIITLLDRLKQKIDSFGIWQAQET